MGFADLPINGKTIGCKWLFKIKYKYSREIERYKAILVAKGFSQSEGIDYEENFSPVVKMVTVRCIISLAVHNNWPVFQLDVNNVFLYGDLHEDVYMDFPPRPAATPMQQNVSLSHIEIEKDKNLKSLTKYLKLRVPRYLKMSLGAGIQFYHGNSLSLHAFSDADWAKCLVTRKSVSGLCVYLCGNLILWKSKKQATLSRSSAEAKYRCMASTTWLIHLLKDLNVEGLLPIPLYYDSTYAIQIAANLVFHEKTKHIEIDEHLVREKVVSGVISIVKVNSGSQVVDIFTKSLSIVQHKQFCEKLNMVDIFEV
ncbi:ribonuclease H-like domain-containing protein [Tanacetum coccineum]